MAPDILPFVGARGSWGAMGEQVGQVFAPLIDRHLGAWIAHVCRETGATRDAVIAAAQPYAQRIRTMPVLWEELRAWPSARTFPSPSMGSRRAPRPARQADGAGARTHGRVQHLAVGGGARSGSVSSANVALSLPGRVGVIVGRSGTPATVKYDGRVLGQQG